MLRAELDEIKAQQTVLQVAVAKSELMYTELQRTMRRLEERDESMLRLLAQEREKISQQTLKLAPLERMAQVVDIHRLPAQLERLAAVQTILEQLAQITEAENNRSSGSGSGSGSLQLDENNIQQQRVATSGHHNAQSTSLERNVKTEIPPDSVATGRSGEKPREVIVLRDSHDMKQGRTREDRDEFRVESRKEGETSQKDTFYTFL